MSSPDREDFALFFLASGTDLSRDSRRERRRRPCGAHLGMRFASGSADDLARLDRRSEAPRMTRPSEDDTEVAIRLTALERRLSGAPHEILGVAPRASNSEACFAFITLSHPFHPAQFPSRDPALVHRAALAYQRLKGALEAMTAAPVRRTR